MKKSEAGISIERVTIFPPHDGRETDEELNYENTRNLNHLTAAHLALECEVTAKVRKTEKLGLKILTMKDTQVTGKTTD